jgi:hypothetical protein
MAYYDMYCYMFFFLGNEIYNENWEYASWTINDPKIKIAVEKGQKMTIVSVLGDEDFGNVLEYRFITIDETVYLYEGEGYQNLLTSDDLKRHYAQNKFQICTDGLTSEQKKIIVETLKERSPHGWEASSEEFKNSLLL